MEAGLLRYGRNKRQRKDKPQANRLLTSLHYARKMPDNAVRLPNNTQRLTVIGRTGTGKTQAGLWHLSLKDFKKFPWIIFDAKGDPLINEVSAIPGVKQIDFSFVPKYPGLYHLRATPPSMKSDAMEALLWRIHKRGKVGLFFDEGFTFDPRSDALNTIYTQGRALKIPTITLTQRPSWLSRFVFSEADFFQIFGLNDRDDRKTVQRFVPVDMDLPLREFHSIWYDVGKNSVREFLPVPQRDTILDQFEANVRRPKLVI